jgi:hypothetical protein
MSAALYIVLEKAKPGFDAYVDGRALSRAEEGLRRLAERLGVTPLMSFFSMDPDEMLAEAREFNTGVTADTVPAEQWFPASEGLRTVRALIEYIDAHPTTVIGGPEVANELAGFVHVLEEAEKHRIRWHLAVDY